MAEGMSAREFLERELRNDPNLGFAEVQERGRRLGLNIPPFLYGSARRSLGLPARPDLVEPTPSRYGAAAPAEDAPVAEPELAGDVADDAGIDGNAVETEAPAAKVESKNTAFQFAVEMLKLTPDLSFQDLKARAHLADLRMQPIVYGRAKALLGLVPTKPRQPRKKAEPEAPRSLRQVETASTASAPAPTRAPTPRPASAAPSFAMPSSIGSLEQLIGMVRELEGERQRLRATLAAIQAAVDEALAADEG